MRFVFKLKSVRINIYSWWVSLASRVFSLPSQFG
jgi:hypothetical protein